MDTLIRAASALDAAPAWPEGDVVRQPLREALDLLIEQERAEDGSMEEIEVGMEALGALIEHSDAADALFGSAVTMCA